MKKIFTIVAAILLTVIAFAQAPQKMSYQAVIRDASNALVVNQTVGMQVSILQGSASGTAVYVETHSAATNTNGLVSIEIGGGTVTVGSFAAIDWANGPYFIKTETDPAGGTNYTITGTSQLLSVPYAMYAANSGSSIPGPQGPQGPAGNDGAIGPQGPIGADGPQGPQGLTGVAGAVGPQGQTGATGPQGLQGPQGLAGSVGATGATGPQGPIGATGPQGPAGNDGAPGPQGPQGATGPQGPAGNDGAPGPQGPAGNDGATGPQGPQGPAGTYTAGSGISINNNIISNTQPDQTVSITGTGISTATGTYPNFTVNTPAYNAGIGININGQTVNAQNDNPIWNASKLYNVPVNPATPVNEQFLFYDGSNWKPGNLNSSQEYKRAITLIYTTIGF